ncbi:MAG: ATP-dependent helicase HrpB [Verrucomicrobia bacterium]|nr:ATP-dependent helicase HrpB [Verrucomicrobiota bacterium]
MVDSRLPIFELEQKIVDALAKNPRLILQAPTGSGKSTQVPQILLDYGLAGEGQIVVLQPRRLPTRLLAARIAEERGSVLGREVGYQIRLDNVTSRDTRIRFVTEGILLRQMVSDPELSGVSTIIFDEFHERHLYSDIALARGLDIQEQHRPNLQLIVMSATLDTEQLRTYLSPCTVLTSAGRMFPVQIDYLKRQVVDEPPWELAADALAQAEDDEGDVLIFMPGAYEIARTIEEIKRSRFDGLVLPLHGDLSARAQDAAVASYDKRKVVVSTNVAETSLTIDGITLVIDSGLAKIARYDPHRGINTLITEKISRASGDQRAGRAGRTAAGRCIRLWSERDQLNRRPQDLPEVKRLDLAEVILNLKASGVTDIARFRWLEKPDSRSLSRAIELLTDLGALDHTEKITSLGNRMLSFPVHPRYSRMLLMAHELRCVSTIALIAALTQERVLLRKADNKQMEHEREILLGGEAESDFFVLIRAWIYANQQGAEQARRLGIRYGVAQQVGHLFAQFLEIAKAENLDTVRPPDDFNAESLGKCLLVGFSDHLARRLDAGTLRCDLVHNRRGVLARESVVQKSPLFVAAEIREVESRNEELLILLSLATAAREEWLRELYPEDFRERHGEYYDPALRRVIGRTDLVFRDLLLHSRRTDPRGDDTTASVLAAEVISGRCPLDHWDHEVEQWITRLNCLHDWCPELKLPEIDEQARHYLISQICEGATTYREIKERSVWSILKGWLPPLQLPFIDRLAPARYTLPGGKRLKLQYTRGQSPVLSARIQDLYGVEQGLKVCSGRVPVLIHVLAPNNRPIQITQELTTFWREAYPKLKLELQRKYPRHEWR